MPFLSFQKKEKNNGGKEEEQEEKTLSMNYHTYNPSSFLSLSLSLSPSNTHTHTLTHTHASSPKDLAPLCRKTVLDSISYRR